MNGQTLLLKHDGSYLFGDTAKILTSENMREAFGVEVLMREEMIDGKHYTSLIPLSVL